jgi:streptogramin lyase
MRALLGVLVLAGSAAAEVTIDEVTIDTVVGTGEKGYSGDGGPAIKARLNQPFHCDLDGKGGLYIAEAGNHCIRKVDLKSGTITTVAGCGKKGYSGDGGPATKATLNEPYAVAVDKNGDLYIVDRLNRCVRKVDGKTGIITTVAGTGKPGYSGDGGPGPKAMLREPNDCFLDRKGGLLIADVADWRIRRLDLKTGVITTFAGTGRVKGKIDRKKIGDGGPATKAVIVGARAVCVNGAGETYICEREGNAIRWVTRDGIIRTFAGTGEAGNASGPKEKATFRGPKGVRCDDSGNVYVVDTENHSIRYIGFKAGHARLFVGPGDARLARPHGCVIDDQGTVYIADSENHRVRRVRR